jgi:hypothetical protein
MPSNLQHLIANQFIFPHLFDVTNKNIDGIITGGTYSNGILGLQYFDGTSLNIPISVTGGTGTSGTTVTGGNFDSINGILTINNSNGTSVNISGFTTTNNPDVFTSNIPVVLSNNKTFGKFINGTTIPSSGLTSQQVISLACFEFLIPSFTSFNISGQPSPIESGTGISSGSKTFTWSNTNGNNISANTISIINVSAGNTILASGLPNIGSDVITLSSTIPLTGTTTQIFQISAYNTQGTLFTGNYNIQSLYKIFYGDSSTTPIDSPSVRSLTSNRFTNAGNTFSLFTGTVNKTFSVAIPSTNTLVSVFDVSASNADITSQYVLTTFTVNDIGGNPVSYKIYTMNQAVPYTTSHNHSITYM